MANNEEGRKGDRPFPWKCPACLKQEVVPARIPYPAEIKYDGALHSVPVPNLEIPRCRSCGELLFNDHADEQINEALRSQLRLLSPTQISLRRVSLGLNPSELAKKLGVGEETICRWENGAFIQTRAMDNLLRLYFALPKVREVLRGEDQDPALGMVEVG